MTLEDIDFLDNPDDALAGVRKVLALQETRLGQWWVVLHR